MKTQKVVTEIEANINRRFFQAMAALEELGSIRSLSGFCDEVGLSSPRFREMRLEYGVAPAPGRVSRYSSLNMEALYYLVKDYGVSGDWLLSGRGKMFR